MPSVRCSLTLAEFLPQRREDRNENREAHVTEIQESSEGKETSSSLPYDDLQYLV